MPASTRHMAPARARASPERRLNSAAAREKGAPRSRAHDSSSSRCYRIAGIPILVAADLPITDRTFSAKFQVFRAGGPPRGRMRIEHHFSLPRLIPSRLGRRVYNAPPWAIHRRDDAWTYVGTRPGRAAPRVFMIAEFDPSHHVGRIYHENSRQFLAGGAQSLSLFPTDQIWLARALAGHGAFFLHAAGMKVAGHGVLFAGHSGAGKSTMVTVMRGAGEILCDDRIVVRRWPGGFRIHGTWSHGDVPDVSAGSAPLRAILFLEQAKENRLVPLPDARERLERVLPLLVKPLVSADWWEQMLAVIAKLVAEVPAYRLRFDRSGKIGPLVTKLLAGSLDPRRPGHRGAKGAGGRSRRRSTL